MNPSTNPSALRSKKEITDALLLLMTRFPYDEIATKQIILQSGVSRKTFYRNFDSKDDVLNSYIDSRIDEYVQDLLHMEVVSLSNILDTIFVFCQKNAGMIQYLARNNRLHLMQYALNQTIPVLHKQLNIGSNPIFSEIDNADYVIRFNVGGIFNMMELWISNGMKDSVEDIKKNIERYIRNLSKFADTGNKN